MQCRRLVRTLLVSVMITMMTMTMMTFDPGGDEEGDSEEELDQSELSIALEAANHSAVLEDGRGWVRNSMPRLLHQPEPCNPNHSLAVMVHRYR